MSTRARTRVLARRLVQDSRSALLAMRRPALLFWGAYLFATPLYVWRSGLPQPGDYLVVFLAPLALSGWSGRLPGSSVAMVRALLFFVGYVVAANLFWSVTLQAWSLSLKRGFGLSPLFYVFNGVIFLLVLVLHRTYRSLLLSVTATVVLVTLLAQVMLSFVISGGAQRATILFNNPNQLGYFALLSASALVLLQRRGHATTLQVALGSLMATYLGLLSASKAALAGIVLLGLAGVFTRLRTMVLAGVVLALLLAIPSPMSAALSRATNRIQTDESHAFFEERGYDRIENHPEYWLLGSGEGAYRRFKDTTTIGAHEIHSSLGTLFFCYGIVGTLLFAAFVFHVLRGSGLATWIIVAPSLAYGMTHQGLRFTMFWVLLGLVAALRQEQTMRALTPGGATPPRRSG